MKKFILIAIALLVGLLATAQTASPNKAMTDKQYADLVTAYLQNAKGLPVYAYRQYRSGARSKITPQFYQNSEFNDTDLLPMPDGELKTKADIVNTYGADYYQCVRKALTTTVPVLQRYKCREFADVEIKRSLSYGRLAGGATALGVSVIAYCIGNAVIDKKQYTKMDSASNARLGLGIGCGAVALVGTILMISAPKQEVRINKNTSFDINGNSVGFSQSF